MVGMGSGKRNAALVRLLDSLGWSVQRLADEVNREMGTDYVSRPAVSEWVNISRVPRQPLPTVVSHVLAQALGMSVDVSHLWPDASACREWVASDAGMRVPWDLTGTKALLNFWPLNGGEMEHVGRRHFMAVSGATLTAPAWQYINNLHHDIPPTEIFNQTLGAAYSKTKTSPATVEYFHSVIAALRRMDDIEGGSAEGLKEAGQHISQVVAYLNNSTFTGPTVARDLMEVLAQLSQIGGWMAYDAEQHGLAQRYFRAGLHAAHSIGNRELGSHILGSMSYQAAERGKFYDAIDLGDAATSAAKGTHPLVDVAALSRLAHAHAATGDIRGFWVIAEKMRRLFERVRTIKQEAPSYLYWMDDVAIDTLTGQGALLLSLRNKRTSLLSQSARLLDNEVFKNAELRPRYATLHGIWLARAYVQNGDLYQGLHVAEKIVSRITPSVSPRTRTVLHGLDQDLAKLRNDRNLPEVRALRTQLQPAFIN